MNVYAEIAINLQKQGASPEEINQVLRVIGGVAPPVDPQPPPPPPTSHKPRRKWTDAKKLVKPVLAYAKSKNGHNASLAEMSLSLYDSHKATDETEKEFRDRVSWAITALLGKGLTRVSRAVYSAS